MENFLNFLQENWVEILSTAGTIALILAKTKGTVDPKTAQERKYKKSVNKELKLLKKAQKIHKEREQVNVNSNETESEN